MIIVMKKSATDGQIDRVVEWIESVGYRAHLSRGTEKTIIGAVGDARGREQIKSVAHMAGVETVVPILKPYKLASREFQGADTVVRVGDVEIGNGSFTVMAGPCAVETEEQLMESAWVAKKAGAQILRGGAFKPRTSPYSFQGLEEEGLKLLKKVRERTGLPVVTEVVNPADVDLVEACQLVLGKAGHEVRGAHNVRDGAAALEEETPDLLILAVMMESPDDGITLAQRLRRLGFDRPILMLTSISRVTGLTYGRDNELVPVDDFIEKPVAPATLVAAVNALLAAAPKAAE